MCGNPADGFTNLMEILPMSGYDIQPFDSKTSRPREGMRLAKIGYKTPKNGAPKKQSVCVSVPHFSLDSVAATTLQLLMPHFEAYCEGVQDSIIRERSEEGAVLITASDISAERVLEYLDADARGDRLTKELVQEWFDSALLESITVAFADKFGIGDEPTDAESRKLNQAITVYRDKFASMAGGRTSFSKEVATKLHKVLELDTEDSGITVRFRNRLQKMMTDEGDILEGL